MGLILLDMSLLNWEPFFNRLKRLVYPALVKDFLIHDNTTDLMIYSFILGRKISITEQSIAKLISHNGHGKICFNMITKGEKGQRGGFHYFQTRR